MGTATFEGHIEAAKGIAGGRPRIAGHRITVQDIAIWHEWLGLSADRITAEHNLRLADVYAALTYYYDHQDEIDRSIQESKTFIEALRHNTPSRISQKLDDPSA